MPDRVKGLTEIQGDYTGIAVHQTGHFLKKSHYSAAVVEPLYGGKHIGLQTSCSPEDC